MSRIARAAPVVALGLLLATTQPVPAAVSVPPPLARAVCGPGSIPEPLGQRQGRVTAADLASGTGFRCNLEMIGHEGSYAGFRTYRYLDRAGRECAFYDSTPYLPTRPNSSIGDGDTVDTHVLDMSDPAHPVRTADLETPAMGSPHESLNLHVGRGLLAANMGNLVTFPGFVDVYDVSADCRHPVRRSSLPVGLFGHEGAFSPDGKTFWVSAPFGGYASSSVGNLAAVDVTNPALPRLLWATERFAPHGLNISADGNTLYFGDAGTNRGLTILDVLSIQARRPVPSVRVIGHLTWPTVSIPQTPIPVSIGGHPYLVEVDEFTHDTITNYFTNQSMTRPEDLVGAVRMIDIANPSRPRVVSNMRLEVNQPAARRTSQNRDPGADTATGYTAHYCAVPSQVDPGIVACTFILSGLRVFDIHDPLHPKEIAYFNPPGVAGHPYAAMSAPAFVPERGEIWYTDANYGFYALKVTNGVWP